MSGAPPRSPITHVDVSWAEDVAALFNPHRLMSMPPLADLMVYPLKFTLQSVTARLPATDSKGMFKKDPQGYTDAYLKVYTYSLLTRDALTRMAGPPEDRPKGSVEDWCSSSGHDQYKKERKTCLRNVFTSEVTDKIPCPGEYSQPSLDLAVPFELDADQGPPYRKGLHEVGKRVVVIECWDKDKMSKDDLILRHCIDMAKIPWDVNGKAECTFDRPTHQAEIERGIKSNRRFQYSWIKCGFTMELLG